MFRMLSYPFSCHLLAKKQHHLITKGWYLIPFAFGLVLFLLYLSLFLLNSSSCFCYPIMVSINNKYKTEVRCIKFFSMAMSISLPSFVEVVVKFTGGFTVIFFHIVSGS